MLQYNYVTVLFMLQYYSYIHVINTMSYYCKYCPSLQMPCGHQPFWRQKFVEISRQVEDPAVALTLRRSLPELSFCTFAVNHQGVSVRQMAIKYHIPGSRQLVSACTALTPGITPSSSQRCSKGKVHTTQHRSTDRLWSAVAGASARTLEPPHTHWSQSAQICLQSENRFPLNLVSSSLHLFTQAVLLCCD